jgi:NADH-quinone oxidoreductase subunit N
MNDLLTIILEVAVTLLGLGFLMLDLFTPAHQKRYLGYAAAAGVALVLLFSFTMDVTPARHAFGQSYVLDSLALFFKQFFMLAAIIVLVMAVDFSDRIETGISEFYSLILFALSGMMFASSANDFTLLFVSLELITVTFYVLTSFQRSRIPSLEAGVKYLIIGALSSAFLVYGIALVYGTTGTMDFVELAKKLSGHPELSSKGILSVGLVMILAGLGFKIAAVPFQVWAPDVYQGSPTPATAFLAVGSKAAGIVLMMRVLGSVVTDVALHWEKLMIGMSAFTILYGSLCAIPQRNLKRLLGYSSIASAGYLLLGFVTMTRAGSSAILYYLTGYLFTVLGAFTVLCVVVRKTEVEDISALAGLHRRSPLLATAMTLSMVSLAGVPPLAGFIGKFLLLKALLAQASGYSHYYLLLAVAVLGVLISFYYYFGVVRAIYWSKDPADLSTIQVSTPMKLSLYTCMAGMLFLGLWPDVLLSSAEEVVQVAHLWLN